ncbi:MAG: carboxypeptidase regulatory-like domain-containing protein [Acidobacteriia bacterium]|nr:carboxypeptidase regulatory-like domain-containing protein [Terriglobia bacterium]
MKRCFLLLASSLAFSFLAGSQQPLVGSIQGFVKNPQGAPIPYATLIATNLDSVERQSNVRNAGADKQGYFEFVAMPPGRFAIVVKANGYRDYTIPEITVHDGESVKIPEIKMTPANPPAGGDRSR